MKINLFNTKNPNGRLVPVTLTIEEADITSTNDGEVIYMLAFHSGAKALTGQKVIPIYINTVTAGDVMDKVQEGLALIGEQIDWGALENDTYAPIIKEMTPMPGEQNVPISNNVQIKLTDPFPSSFLDLTSIKLYANDTEVNVTVTEKEADVFIDWIPPKITTI